eukprot:TRINITY_DN41955_c0_g1_i2.p1 TRINITY_DN41955_c0_g1~~TRINITY_DN41955_c0_g1_i2.p1  ORF type:complete len:438 (-),score=96.32 TRINITY_DN41955_c0_g1_i2:508-1821(-)
MPGGVKYPSEDELTGLRAATEEACKTAAQRIANADVLLLCTGAGFSADSGLAVYKDVAEVPAYKQRGLTYSDVCSPEWLDAEPELFWGFWGQCYNDYRQTAPHEGYQIIERWVERRFRHSPIADALRMEQEKLVDYRRRIAKCDPFHVEGNAGGFFAFTSNVDAHHFDWFQACEIVECHGNVELYQCAGEKKQEVDEFSMSYWPSRRAICDMIWRCPLDFRFVVDKASMLAPASGEDKSPVAADLENGRNDEDEAPDSEAKRPCVGHVKGGGRPHLLRHMPAAAEHCSESALAEAFSKNHPSCPACGGVARPCILMFGDFDWKPYEAQDQQFVCWKEAGKRMSSRQEQAGAPLKVAVLEIGAGDRVATVRRESEDTVMMFQMAGADTTLIRVNPEIPYGDHARLGPGGRWENSVLSILGSGLETLRKIDAAMPEAML